MFNPWDAPKSQNWFNRVTRLPEVGQRSEKYIPGRREKTSIPIVGKSDEYVPPWLVDFARKDLANVPENKPTYLSDKNRPKSVEDVSYGEFPAISLSFPPFHGNLQKSQNGNGNVIKNNDAISNDDENESSKSVDEGPAEKGAGKMLFTPSK